MLAEENYHHESIPGWVEYRINYPAFWKEDFTRNFKDESQYKLFDEKKYIRYLLMKIAPLWPSGLGILININTR